MKKKKNNPPEPTFEERLAWLLAFLKRDLATLRPGERLDLEADVVRFLHDPAAIIPTAPPDPYRIALAKLRGELPAPEPDPLKIGDQGVLEGLQRALRSGVRHFNNGLRWTPFDRSPSWVFEPRADR